VTAEHHIGRRTFVGLLAASGIVGASLANDLARGASRADATTAAAKGPDGVVRLGKAYLRAHPREADTKFLLARLPGIDPTQRVRPQMPTLVPSITQDFETGRVITVQGWQLSRTEARVAAAVALGA